ncbi:unnamed protein product, partial [Leptidea sinapis]
MSALCNVRSLIEGWRPKPPVVEERTKRSVTLAWSAEPFSFLHQYLIYTIQRKEKVPAWISVRIAAASDPPFNVSNLIEEMKAVENAEEYFPNDATNTHSFNTKECKKLLSLAISEGSIERRFIDCVCVVSLFVSCSERNSSAAEARGTSRVPAVESQWSEETWTSTDSDGTSAACFCMAVRCGFLKQVQQMLEERPVLLGAINSANGFTPLASAVRKGDLNTVRFLVSAGADLEQPSTTGQHPLHLAALGGHMDIV